MPARLEGQHAGREPRPEELRGQGGRPFGRPEGLVEFLGLGLGGGPERPDQGVPRRQLGGLPQQTEGLVHLSLGQGLSALVHFGVGRSDLPKTRRGLPERLGPEPLRGLESRRLQLGHLPGPGQALRGQGMAQEERLHGRRLPVVARLQDLHHLDHALGVVAGRRHVLHAELVGLALLVAAVLHEHQVRGQKPPLREELAPLDPGGFQGHEPDGGQDAREHLPGVARGLVAGRHVPDLVAQHGRELRLVLHARQKPPGDRDLPPGQGVGVDLGGVHHVELVGKPRPVAQGREPSADLGHVGLEGRIGKLPLGDLGVDRIGLLAHAQLLLLAHEHELLAPGHRVDGAAGEEEHERGAEPQSSPNAHR